VHQCALFAKGVLMLHFVHTYGGVYTLCEANCAHFLIDLTNLV
jgi:hypothetical protein